MASTISSVDSDLLKLAPTFQTAIKTIIDSESTSLKKVQAQKDQIDIRRGVYTDVKTNLDALQSAVQALISSQETFGMSMVAKASVTPGTTGSSVLSATTTNENAVSAEYAITGYMGNTGIQLAKAESRASAVSINADVALGKSGTFWLGGTGTASLDAFTSPSTSVTAAALGTVVDGQRELGSGDYSVQVRDYDGMRQFRLVNADGTAMSINKIGGSGSTSGWQAMTDGIYDTGRGLTFTMNTSGAVGSTALPAYTAKGVSISITATDTQRTIATAINSALQPEGHDFKASIVSNQLVLTGTQTGENHTLQYKLMNNDVEDNFLGFGGALQVAQNAKFQVNGMDVSRASNSNLTDVIDGVTVNLASDAAGKTANLTITGSSDKATGLMNALVSKFNAAFTHLTQKLTSTSKTDSTTGKTNYTRGALAGDTTMSSLRNELSYRMNRVYTNSGSFNRLSEIGLSFDKDQKLVFDSAKFTDAIKNNTTDLTALMDASLGEVNTLLSHYSGSSGMLSSSLSTIDVSRAQYDKRIAKYNEALTARKQALFNQYLGYQTQLANYGYEAQLLGLMLGTTTSTTGNNVNTSG